MWILLQVALQYSKILHFWYNKIENVKKNSTSHQHSRCIREFLLTTQQTLSFYTECCQWTIRLFWNFCAVGPCEEKEHISPLLWEEMCWRERWLFGCDGGPPEGNSRGLRHCNIAIFWPQRIFPRQPAGLCLCRPRQPHTDRHFLLLHGEDASPLRSNHAQWCLDDVLFDLFS